MEMLDSFELFLNKPELLFYKILINTQIVTISNIKKLIYAPLRIRNFTLYDNLLITE